MLRDTIATLRIFCRRGAIDIKREGCDLIENALTALQNPDYFSRQGGVESIKSAVSVDKLRHVNVWLIASTLLDLISAPPDMLSLGSEGDSSVSPCTATPSTVEQGEMIDESLAWLMVCKVMEMLREWIMQAPGWMLEQTDFSMLSEKAASHAKSAPSDSRPSGPLPLSHASGGVCWVMIRLLCAFLSGNKLCASSASSSSSSPEDFSKAHILQVLDWLEVCIRSYNMKESDYITFEFVNVIAHITSLSGREVPAGQRDLPQVVQPYDEADLSAGKVAERALEKEPGVSI